MKAKSEGTRVWKEDDIAIIGMAGRFPEADNLEEFWENLKNGRDSIRDLPESRKEELRNILGELPEITYARAGYVERISYFEPEIFGISREESKFIDPQQRLLLELVEEAFLDAGYNPEMLSEKKIGVFIAQNENQYTKNYSALSPMAFQNSNNAVGAGRVAYTYNLTGPAVTIGTACSSGLVALHQAWHSLKYGESEMAIVGGVKLNLLPGDESSIGATPILSRDQKVKTFDRSADGTVGGEGGGVLLLKPLHLALEDGDYIHAVIKGSGVNSDGNRSNGMSSPSEEGQAEVILQAIENAGIDPQSISFIETHGTGTKIGDPIEVQGINQALVKLGYPKHTVAVSAVKANIGHLDGAAGLAGVIKTVLSLKNQKLVPSINFTNPNPLIDFIHSPVYVNDQYRDWQSIGVLRAGITSLGITGTNSHVILEEPPIIEKSSKEYENIIVLSARTEESLSKMTVRLADYLESQLELLIQDIAYTLNLGRRDLKHKLVIIAESREELISKLRSYNSFVPDSGESEFVQFSLRSKDHKVITPALLIPDIHDMCFEGLVERFRTEPGYVRYMQEFIEQSGELELSEQIKNYALVVYGWIKLLKDYQVKPKVILGFGIGSIVANMASGQLDFLDGLNQLLQYSLRKIDIPEAKLSPFLDTMIQQKVNTFVLLSPDEELAKLFKKVISSKEEITLINQGVKESVLAVIPKLMSLGFRVNWQEVYAEVELNRVSLPGYVFDSQSYYLPIQAPTLQLPVTSTTPLEIDAELLHHLVWQEEGLVGDNQPIQGTWLILKDQLGIGSSLVRRLDGEGVVIIEVETGPAFKQITEHSYQLNLADPISYHQLFDILAERGENLVGVVNLVNCSEPTEYLSCSAKVDLTEGIERGYYHFLCLAQALITRYTQLRLYQITTNAYRITRKDSLICPEKRLIWALNKVLNQEMTDYRSYCLDFDLANMTVEEVSHQILAEIQHGDSEILELAYRENNRYVQYLTPVNTPLQNSPIIKEGGVYLITGGLGGIGLQIAKYFADLKPVQLILLNRRSLSERTAEEQAEIQKSIAELKQQGASVELVTGDVADYQQMGELVNYLEDTYGKIDGVVHTAGLPGTRPRIPAITKEDVERLFAAKIYGTVNLAELLKDQFLDFFITCSSLSSQVGGFGFGIYGVANSFLDSFCGYQRQLGKKFISINWGNWGEVGMAVKTNDRGYASGLSNLTNQEGIQAFAAILHNNLDNYAVNRFTAKVTRLFASFEFFKIAGKSIDQQNDSVEVDGRSIDESLFSMFADVYVGDELELNDRILDLDLDSIDLMQFVGKLKKAYNVNVPLKLFFEDLTFGELLERLKVFIIGETVIEHQITRQPEQEYYPVSTGQNRLYMVNQLDPQSVAYNLNSFLILEGQVDVGRIESAVRELICRHESLRTSFSFHEGRVVQQVHHEIQFDMPVVEGLETELEELQKQFIQPFDLAKAPLFRVQLVKFADKYLLMMDLHHIIFDGVSQNIFFKEFLALYQGMALPETSLHYRDFAVWQRELLSSVEINQQKQYWLERFAGELPQLNLPTDYPRPKVIDFTGDRYRFSVDLDLTAKLNQLAKAQGVTMFMLLLAAYNILLGKYANQEDLVIGVITTGRHHSDLENIIGMFVNTLPLRNYPLKSQSVSEFLAAVKENTLQAFDSQDYPLEMLTDQLNLVHDPGRNPLFDVVFNLNNQRRDGEFADIHLNGVKLKMQARELTTSTFDLSLDGVELAGKIEFELEYRTSLFTAETIVQMAADLLHVLKIMVTDPEIKIQMIQLREEPEVLETGSFTDIGFDF